MIDHRQKSDSTPSKSYLSYHSYGIATDEEEESAFRHAFVCGSRHKAVTSVFTNFILGSSVKMVYQSEVEEMD
jgi:hypothetical protein